MSRTSTDATGAVLSRQHLAARVGLLGAGLGVLSGVVAATLGAEIPHWTGNKDAPVALGLLTVVLSLVALAAALVLRGRDPLRPGPRVVCALGVLVPAGLCSSTVGRLWYLPGMLLLASAVLSLAAGGTAVLRPVVAANWTRLLVSLLGAFEVLVAVSAGPVLTIVVGTVGGLALTAAPWVLAGVRARLVLLCVGSLPFAVLTWWSVAGPLLAVVALAVGIPVLRHGGRATPAGAAPLGATPGAAAPS